VYTLQVPHDKKRGYPETTLRKAVQSGLSQRLGAKCGKLARQFSTEKSVATSLLLSKYIRASSHCIEVYTWTMVPKRQRDA
jgi:hypothetical protein